MGANIILKREGRKTKKPGKEGIERQRWVVRRGFRNDRAHSPPLETSKLSIERKELLKGGGLSRGGTTLSRIERN